MYATNWHLDLLQPFFVLLFAPIRILVPSVSGDLCQYTLHTTVSDGYPCTEDDIIWGPTPGPGPYGPRDQKRVPSVCIDILRDSEMVPVSGPKKRPRNRAPRDACCCSGRPNSRGPQGREKKGAGVILVTSFGTLEHRGS